MKRLFLSLWVLLIMGCVSAPQVQPIPQRILSAPDLHAGVERTTAGRWWQWLQDETLDELVELGLQGNPTTQIALARLAQAEEDLKIAKSTRWPSLLAIGTREARTVSGSGTGTRLDIGALELSWEAGWSGKRRLEIERARKFKGQRWFERQSVQLALSASIAETYYQIIEQRMQSTLLVAQLEVSADLERLIEARFRRGQARANEIYQQRESTQTLARLKINSDTNLEVLERRLDVLLGEIPDTIPRVTTESVPTKLAIMRAGSPEDLIKHRADIRAGYARLQQIAALAGNSICRAPAFTARDR